MKRLNQWLIGLANLGVFFGIIFLIVELQQNTQMLEDEAKAREAEAFGEITKLYIDVRRDLIASPALSELVGRTRQGDAGKFTPTELTLLNAYVTIYPQIVHAAYRYKEAGHLPDVAWKQIEKEVDQRRKQRNLYDKMYMTSMGNMPIDVLEYFSIPAAEFGKPDWWDQHVE